MQGAGIIPIQDKNKINSYRGEKLMSLEERKMFGRGIKVLRVGHDGDEEMTQEKLAKEVGVSRHVVSRIEAGHTEPSAGFIKRLFPIFGKGKVLDTLYPDEDERGKKRK